MLLALKQKAWPYVERWRDLRHEERRAVLPYVTGRCLEIGCGHRRTSRAVIAVDLTPGGATGTVGNVAGKRSRADVGADGAALPFRSAGFDSIVARHNLEHYRDTAATLTEWRRVLAAGGTVAVVVPDEERFDGSTLDLDPTHHQAFTERSLSDALTAAGFVVRATRPVVVGWSFLAVAQRPSA